MEKIESVLKFDKYEVKEVSIKSNENFVRTNEPLKISFSIHKDVQHNTKGKMVVTLMVSIFENAEQNNYPFEMTLKISGFFINNDDSINLDANAIAILYPYVRSIVSVFTSSVNVPQLILPVINVNALIDQIENSKED